MPTIEIITRGYLGPMHISAACFFARQAIDIQKSLDAKSSSHANFYAAAAVNSSVAFLEATINELLADCHEDEGFAGIVRKKKIPKKDRRSLRTLWGIFEKGKLRVSVLNKYKFALQFLGREELNTGTDPWGQAKALVVLRNYLTHFVPEDEVVPLESIPAEEIKVVKALRGRFPLHPEYSQRGHPAFQRLLSAGCAVWGVKSSVAFADTFFKFLGIHCPYESIRPALDGLKI